MQEYLPLDLSVDRQSSDLATTAKLSSSENDVRACPGTEGGVTEARSLDSLDVEKYTTKKWFGKKSFIQRLVQEETRQNKDDMNIGVSPAHSHEERDVEFRDSGRESQSTTPDLALMDTSTNQRYDSPFQTAESPIQRIKTPPQMIRPVQDTTVRSNSAPGSHPPPLIPTTPYHPMFRYPDAHSGSINIRNGSLQHLSGYTVRSNPLFCPTYPKPVFTHNTTTNGLQMGFAAGPWQKPKTIRACTKRKLGSTGSEEEDEDYQVSPKKFSPEPHGKPVFFAEPLDMKSLKSVSPLRTGSVSPLNTEEDPRTQWMRMNNLAEKLPLDPRKWSREDVRDWLLWCQIRYNLPTMHFDRFLMNGKALCLMNIHMFNQRVQVGGNILFQNFRKRLNDAIARTALASADTPKTNHTTRTPMRYPSAHRLM